MTKHELLYELTTDNDFRQKMNAALAIPTGTIVNGILGHVCGEPYKVKIPVELRDTEKEEKFVRDLIGYFNSQEVKDVVKILPIVDEENYGYLSTIDTFKSIDLMKKSAESLLLDALDCMWEKGVLICNNYGELEKIQFTIGGQFNVLVEFDVEERNYYGSISYDVITSRNF